MADSRRVSNDVAAILGKRKLVSIRFTDLQFWAREASFSGEEAESWIRAVKLEGILNFSCWKLKSRESRDKVDKGTINIDETVLVEIIESFEIPWAREIGILPQF